ncbi:Protein TolB [uncultured archaeon]|nr:Protein TolB [uncultured archaeon]
MPGIVTFIIVYRYYMLGIMKVSYILIYLALLSLFSVPVSADLNIVSSSVIHTNNTLSALVSLDWSPDGNSIAYVAYDDSRNQQIFTINVDGTGEKKVTNTTNKKWGVAWFDTDISFISYDTDGLEKIFLVKPDGSGLRKLLDDGTRQGRAPEDKPPALGGASWNPKTKTVLFTSFDAAANEKIYEVNIDGTGKKQLINDSFRQWNPEWSPDWNSFVYVSYDSTYIEQLFTANADGSGKKQITFDGIKKSDPDWGLDGIVYVSYETATSSGQQIFIINPDGSGKKLLYTDGFREIDPMWSRDGSKIVYVDIDPQGKQVMRVLNLQKPAVTTPSPTPTPTATGITTPTPTFTPTPTPTGTPGIKETPAKSALQEVVSSMLLVLGLIVVLMLVILLVSNLLNKKK